MSIQKMRLKRGWSQQQLADASGLSARTVQRLESGHPGSVETLKSIAAVFEVDFSTLTKEAMMNDETANSPSIHERIAFKRARRIRDCYMHLLMYFVINIGCIAINLLTTPESLWFIGLTLFWGLGVCFHVMTVFVFDKYFNGQWELAQVEKILGRSL
jgi:transcriptional regulator with XRE-family HTH domain